MNLESDEFVIMPNHIHGIIQIGENAYNTFDEKDHLDCGGHRDAMHGVSTSDADGGLIQKGNNKPGPQRKNLSSLIRRFKSAVTTDARMMNSDFGWQSRFYDNIIRDEESLINIRRYIKENPGKWKIDELNPEHE